MPNKAIMLGDHDAILDIIEEAIVIRRGVLLEEKKCKLEKVRKAILNRETIPASLRALKVSLINCEPSHAVITIDNPPSKIYQGLIRCPYAWLTI